mmetsp:Transcript_12021/g.15589  ORF Transcript_12021/g.15589 Transcript_12021/m.15589 type:complete len:279 (-) Transcript_12021:553-1389(-)
MDDIYQRSLELLNNFEIRSPILTPKTNSGKLKVTQADASALVFEENKLEHGYIRNPDGTGYVAVVTPLDTEFGVTGEMVEFWFNFCDTTEKYKCWHPKDHIKCTWNEEMLQIPVGIRAKSGGLGNRGSYIGNQHRVIEKVGGVTQDLRICFCPPEEFFGEDYEAKCREHSITCIVTGAVKAKVIPFGYVTVGSLIHLVQERADGSGLDMKSHFFLGNIKADGVFGQKVLNNVANNSFVRKALMNDEGLEGLFRHCAEEMHCLKHFVSGLYQREMENFE